MELSDVLAVEKVGQIPDFSYPINVGIDVAAVRAVIQPFLNREDLWKADREYFRSGDLLCPSDERLNRRDAGIPIADLVRAAKPDRARVDKYKLTIADQTSLEFPVPVHATTGAIISPSGLAICVVDSIGIPIDTNAAGALGQTAGARMSLHTKMREENWVPFAHARNHPALPSDAFGMYASLMFAGVGKGALMRITHKNEEDQTLGFSYRVDYHVLEEVLAVSQVTIFMDYEVPTRTGPYRVARLNLTVNADGKYACSLLFKGNTYTSVSSPYTSAKFIWDTEGRLTEAVTNNVQLSRLTLSRDVCDILFTEGVQDITGTDLVAHQVLGIVRENMQLDYQATIMNVLAQGEAGNAASLLDGSILRYRTLAQ